MERVSESDQCSWCGSPLQPTAAGDCPVCGKRGRIRKTVVVVTDVRDAQSPPLDMTPQSNQCVACGIALPVDHAGPCPSCGARGQIRRSSTTSFIDLNAPGALTRGGDEGERPSIFSLSKVFLAIAMALAGFYVGRWRGLFIGLAVWLVAVLVHRHLRGSRTNRP